MKSKTAIASISILLSFLIGAWLYPSLPDQIVSHWGVNGEANGYMSKFWGTFLLPIIASVILALLSFLPKIDPKKENISKFRGSYDSFILLIILLLEYIYALSLAWNLGLKINMNLALPPALGILFYYVGVVLGRTKRNWFIGIRTPWTLSSDRVWDETHKIGSKLFKIAGVITFLGILVPKYSFLLVIIPIIIAALYSTIFSYYSYTRE